MKLKEIFMNLKGIFMKIKEEAGEIGDTPVLVVGGIVAVGLMFVFPMMSMSARNDDIAQVAVQSATAEYVSEICSTGKITPEKHDKFIQTLYATGNSYDVDFEIQVSDGTSAKKTTTVNPTKVGEQESYSVFTTEVENTLKKGEDYLLKKGDTVIVTVKNNNQTLFQTLQSTFYSTASDSYQIAAQQAAVVGTSGQ